MGCLQNLDAIENIENPRRIILVGCTSLKSQRILWDCHSTKRDAMVDLLNKMVLIALYI